MQQTWRKAGRIPVGILILIVVVAALSWEITEDQAKHERVQTTVTVFKDLMTALGAIAIGVGVYVAFRRLEALDRQADAAQRNAKTAEDGNVTERFARAVEHLANDDNDVIRLGGIYALERVAKDSDPDHWTVMEVLCAFLREKFPYKGVDGADQSGRSLPTDKQAVCTVLRRRVKRGEPEGLDLLKTDLWCVDLTGASLKNASLGGANLQGATLRGANLSHGKLGNANLRHANLKGADLSNAMLLGNCLEGAILSGANLSGANLSFANLSGADFRRANLEGANLEGADLTNAKYLTHEQIDLAKRDLATVIPEGLRGPEHWKASQTEAQATDKST